MKPYNPLREMILLEIRELEDRLESSQAFGTKAMKSRLEFTIATLRNILNEYEDIDF